MKFLVAVLALAAVAHAAAQYDGNAVVLEQNAKVNADNYNYKFETSNGISGQASGLVKNAGSKAESLEVQGSHQYRDSAGNVVEIKYIANEDGYQPKGPLVPEIPEYILRSIAYTKKHHPELFKDYKSPV